MSRGPGRRLIGSTPVVIGYDADAGGADALALGVGLGSALGQPVIVATVHAAGGRSAAAEVLAGAAALLPDPPVPVEYRVTPSTSAPRGLLELAVESGSACIVVGSAATEGFDRRVFAGSTASRLLSGAECPVAVAPKGLARRGWPGPATVGVAYLPTDEGALALDAAVTVARRAGSALRIYTAISALMVDDGAGARAALAAAVDSVTSTTAGLPVSGHLLVGDVIAELADRPEIDLLFCGSRTYGPVRRVLLGGVSSRLMRRADSPLVVVPRPG